MTIKRLFTGCVVVITWLLVSTLPIHAATFTVTTEGELRQAIVTANSNNTADIIDLSGVTIEVRNNALPPITTDITLQNGTLDGRRGGDYRLLEVSVDGALTLNRVSLINGGGSSFLSGFNSGGAIFNDGGDLTINNSVLDNNAATFGGAIYTQGSGELRITNSTIFNNSATNGSAIYAGANTTLQNSIVWNNAIQIDNNATVTINDSIIQGGWSGAGSNNRNVDPQLTEEVRLSPNSPAINTGNNTWVVGQLDIDGDARIREGIVDVGADEFAPNYDLNDDGVVAPADVMFVINRLGTLDNTADVDSDGDVDLDDARAVLDNLGK